MVSEETPPEERRKDLNTRKVIEVLSEKMDEKLKTVVTWEKLILLLGSFAAVLITAAWMVTAFRADRAEAAAASAQAGVKDLRKDSGEAIQLVREELKETRTDIRGLYRAFRTNQPQPRLAAPVPALPPNPIQPTGE